MTIASIVLRTKLDQEIGFFLLSISKAIVERGCDIHFLSYAVRFSAIKVDFCVHDCGVRVGI